MRTYHYELQICSRRTCEVIRTENYGTDKVGVMMAEARHNAEPFRDTYASVKTIWEGSDPLADRAHEAVARYMNRKNWRP